MVRAEQMIGIDTNVLVRFLVDDDLKQNSTARGFMAGRTAESPAYLSAVALAETIWVLHRRLSYPMPVIFEMLRALLSADAFVIENMVELDALINGDNEPKGDLADHLIAWSCARAGCDRIVTFDRKAAMSVPGLELLQ
jgi:predicted nucleic-acid-binding protein